ncbi:MAG: sigma-54-dependent transcriptional regulator [Planctomycetota bacterium]|jgi:DNA-binding NtrC family response regulator
MPGSVAATPARVLVVDHEADVREVLGEVLRAAGHPCLTVSSAEEALRHLAGREFAVVVSNVVMPGMGGIKLLAEIRARFQSTDVVLVTRFGTIELAVETMKMGARDFLSRPVSPARLVEVVSRLVRGRIGPGPQDRFDVGEGSAIIGRSPPIRRMCVMVRRLRGNLANVLVCGESGTGKELVARAIHFGSERRMGPFIAVNCAGVPRVLAESLFFGHVRGAFTGASGDAPGFFRAADGGTLFLDEVTEVSLDIQAMLLRAIQEREVIPVGSTVPGPVDVRLVAATSRSFRQAIREGRLREDLYYRLGVALVTVPPLRDRRSDIPLLLDHFIALHARRLGCTPTRASQRAVEAMGAYDWPGNIRELSNLVEREYALGTGPVITASDVPSNVGSRRARKHKTKTFKEAERQAIAQAIAETGGQKKRAAELLGVSRQTLYRKLRKHGLRTVLSET